MKWIEWIVEKCLIVFKNFLQSLLDNLGEILCGEPEEYVSIRLIDF